MTELADLESEAELAPTKELHDLWLAVRDEIARLREIVNESPEKWSFDTLMWAADRILAERYPPDIFTGVSGDPGPRLAVALRDCRAAMSQAPIQ